MLLHKKVIINKRIKLKGKKRSDKEKSQKDNPLRKREKRTKHTLQTNIELFSVLWNEIFSKSYSFLDI